MINAYENAFLEALQNVGLSPSLEKEAAEGGVTLQNIWRHPDAHPVVLDYLLLQKYSIDWMTWEPETLEIKIPKDFNTPSLSELNLSKIQACKTLHFVDTFWNRWEVFVWCSMPFNGVFPDFNTMQVPSIAQASVAVDIASRLRNDVPFSEEVDTYVATLHKHDGLLVTQAPFDHLKVDVDIDEAVLANIKKRFPAVRASGIDPSGDTLEDEQLRRMLIVHKFLEENRTRLRQQLRLVHA